MEIKHKEKFYRGGNDYTIYISQGTGIFKTEIYEIVDGIEKIIRRDELKSDDEFESLKQNLIEEAMRKIESINLPPVVTFNYQLRLSHLDDQPTRLNNSQVPVILNNNINEPIGICIVHKDSEGRYLGHLILDEQISEKLFIYYRNDITNDGFYWFNALQLMEKPIKDRPTVQLKERIIK